MAMQTWHYHVIRGEFRNEQLDELGRQGWELVSVTDGPSGATAYLKRPVLPFKERVTLEQREHYARTQGYTFESRS